MFDIIYYKILRERKLPKLLKWVKKMIVQRIKLPNKEIRFLLLDDEWNIIDPVKRYLKHLDQLGRSIYTLRTYCFHLKTYFEFLKKKDLTYMSITEKGKRALLLTDFIGYLKSWQDKKIAKLTARRQNNTINEIMNTVINFYRFLIINGEIEEIPFFIAAPKIPYKSMQSELMPVKLGKQSYFRLRETKKEPEICSRENVMKLVEACKYLRDKLLLLVMYEGGLRLGEALNLWVKDFSVWNNQLHIIQHKGKNQLARVKNQNEGTIEMPEYVMQLFCKYIAEEYTGTDYTYVFVNLRGQCIGEPMQANTIEMKFRQLGKETGIKIHPHILRHSHATELIELGNWDVLDVKTRLRHKHVQTTIDSYIRLSDSYKRKKFREYCEKVKKDGKVDNE